VQVQRDEPMEGTLRWVWVGQVNSAEGPEWKVWNRPPGHRSRSLLAFSAGEAARRQGPRQFERFHLALLAARHVHKKALQERETILDTAREAELDVAQLERDLEDPNILQALARDHEEPRSLGRFRQRRLAAFADDDFAAIQRDLYAVKADAIARLPELVEQFTREAEKVGTVVHHAATIAEAQRIVADVARRHGAKLAVKS